MARLLVHEPLAASDKQKPDMTVDVDRPRPRSDARGDRGAG